MFLNIYIYLYELPEYVCVYTYYSYALFIKLRHMTQRCTRQFSFDWSDEERMMINLSYKLYILTLSIKGEQISFNLSSTKWSNWPKNALKNLSILSSMWLFGWIHCWSKVQIATWIASIRRHTEEMRPSSQSVQCGQHPPLPSTMPMRIEGNLHNLCSTVTRQHLSNTPHTTCVTSTPQVLSLSPSYAAGVLISHWARSCQAAIPCQSEDRAAIFIMGNITAKGNTGEASDSKLKQDKH